MAPEKQLQKLEARAIRAALYPLLVGSLAELNASGATPLEPAAPLTFLSELAQAMLRYRPKSSRAQRRVLRRIVMQPAAQDAEFLQVVLTSYLTPRGPTSPALH